jgi:hypothetical protein
LIGFSPTYLLVLTILVATAGVTLYLYLKRKQEEEDIIAKTYREVVLPTSGNQEKSDRITKALFRMMLIYGTVIFGLMTAWLILLTMAFMNMLEMMTAVLSATVLTLAVVGTAVYLYVASIRYASIGRNLFLVFTDMDGEETVSDFLKVKRITYVDIADFLKYVKSRRLEMLERKLEAIQV